MRVKGDTNGQLARSGIKTENQMKQQRQEERSRRSFKRTRADHPSRPPRLSRCPLPHLVSHLRLLLRPLRCPLWCQSPRLCLPPSPPRPLLFASRPRSIRRSLFHLLACPLPCLLPRLLLCPLPWSLPSLPSSLLLWLRRCLSGCLLPLPVRVLPSLGNRMVSGIRLYTNSSSGWEKTRGTRPNLNSSGWGTVRGTRPNLSSNDGW